MDKLICPILSAAEDVADVLCLEEQCAWYMGEHYDFVGDAKRGCALPVLARSFGSLLPTITANIAMQTDELHRIMQDPNGLTRGG